METDLRKRIDRMAGPPDTASWEDVLNRADTLRSGPSLGGRTFQRPRLVLALAASLLVVALAAPAMAFRAGILDFSDSTPAPDAVQKDFSSLDRGAPPGMEVGVAGEARRALSISSSEGTSSLWVAPTAGGGYCAQLDRLGAGCDRGRDLPMAVSIQRKTSKSPVLIWGSLLSRDVQSVDIRYQDGAVDSSVPTWVSPPINAGFFLVEVPSTREQRGLRPVAVIARDADGGAIASQDIPGAIFDRQ